MVSWQIILYAISSGMYFCLMALGFGLVLRSVKFLNISYGGTFLVGGYVMFLLYRTLTISFFPALVISMVAAGLYSLLSYQLVFGPLLRRKASNFILLIASFGLLTATSATIGMIFGSQSTIIARHLSDISSINIFGGTLNSVHVTGIVFIPIIVAVLAYIRFKTRFGTALRAIEDDSEVAELVGINKNRTLLKTFFLSGILGGLVGIAEGFDFGLIPATGLFYILPTIVVSIIGGIRSFWGGVLGAFILAFAQKLTVVLFGGMWEQAVPFIILIIMLFWKPEGIFKR